MDIEQSPRDRIQARRMRERVGDPRRDGAKAGDLMDAREEANVERAAFALVVVRKELGLVGCHVDRGRALGLACLARETKFKCFFKCRIGKAALEQTVAAQRLPQQMSAPTRRMHLLPRRYVRR